MSILSVINPIRDYIYAGAIVLLLIGFVVFVHHERAVGEAKQIALQQKSDAIATQRDTALVTAAALANNISEGVYEKVIAAPAVRQPAPIRLCSSPAIASVPSTASADQSGNDSADSGRASESVEQKLSDYATAVVKIADDSDAQVTALQAELATIRAEMENAHASSPTP
jgi:hypothetical protein